jgi:hypothetical protein
LDKISSLLENGETALGPSVLTAVAMAGKIKEGSTVVVCTDGLANKGVGSFENTDEF